jgi:hypothetical protein
MGPAARGGGTFPVSLEQQKASFVMSTTTAIQTSVDAPRRNTWVIVFVFCFLGLLIDGADLMLLSYSSLA